MQRGTEGEAQSLNCQLCWLCAQGQLTDRKLLLFYTNATNFGSNPTGGYNGTGDSDCMGKRGAVGVEWGRSWELVCACYKASEASEALTLHRAKVCRGEPSCLRIIARL